MNTNIQGNFQTCISVSLRESDPKVSMKNDDAVLVLLIFTSILDSFLVNNSTNLVLLHDECQYQQIWESQSVGGWEVVLQYFQIRNVLQLSCKMQVVQHISHRFQNRSRGIIEPMPLLLYLLMKYRYCCTKDAGINKSMEKNTRGTEQWYFMMVMMNCFCSMVDQRKVFSHISSHDYCQRSSSSRISATKNLSSDFVE